MEHHAYKSLVSLRLWGAKVEDAGVGSISQLLLAGPMHGLKLTHLEILDDSVGPSGCRAMGDALMLGGNSSLMTLRLDLNRSVLDAGAIELCKGLRTNKTLSVRPPAPWGCPNLAARSQAGRVAGVSASPSTSRLPFPTPPV